MPGHRWSGNPESVCHLLAGETGSVHEEEEHLSLGAGTQVMDQCLFKTGENAVILEISGCAMFLKLAHEAPGDKYPYMIPGSLAVKAQQIRKGADIRAGVIANMGIYAAPVLVLQDILPVQPGKSKKKEKFPEIRTFDS